MTSSRTSARCRSCAPWSSGSRWLLNDGMIYSDILEQTGASSATISRVNRSLSYGTGAYERVFARMKELEAANKKPEA